MDPNDYYAILNLPRTATDAEIKESYKRLSLIFHPDRHNAESRDIATGRFQTICEAFEVLHDKNRRLIYDQYGAEGLDSAWEISAPISKEEVQSILILAFERVREKGLP